MKRWIVSLMIFLLSTTPAWATHRVATWVAPTTNADGTPLTDLAGYNVYRCAATPCTRAAGTLVGSVQAPATSFPLPHGFVGYLTVTAFDASGNESVEDGTVPFDGLAPTAPSGLSVQ